MTPQILDTPRFLDIALSEINTKLKVKFSWLNEAFGRAERYTEKQSDKMIEYPAIYSGSNNYIKLFPDASIGNFSYVVSDEFEITERKYQSINGSSSIEFIFWFDFRAVYPETFETKNVMNCIWDVMKFFNETSFATVDVMVESYNTSVEEIYKGFSHNEIKDQFAMRPYGCFKIKTKIYLKENCSEVPYIDENRVKMITIAGNNETTYTPSLAINSTTVQQIFRNGVLLRKDDTLSEVNTYKIVDGNIVLSDILYVGEYLIMYKF